METAQKLGIKVFLYFLYKKIIIGIILLILSFVALYYKDVIGLKLFFILGGKAGSIINSSIILFFVISLIFLFGGIILSWLDYISCTFILGDNAFSIKRGILNKKEVSIPYRQIQNVSIEQNFSSRTMGVCKLVVLTAGNDNNDKDGEAEGVFDIIDSGVAVKLKNELLHRSNIQNNNINNPI